MLKLIVLDRDGVINYDSPDYIRSVQDWRPIQGSLAAVAALSKAGYHIAIATNQSGVARKYYSVATLERIHYKMLYEIRALGGKIDVIFACMHLPQDDCDCRKPKPGMLKRASQYFNLSPNEMIFIGDSHSDLIAAHSFGCPFILIGETKVSPDVMSVENLAQASCKILQNNGEL